MYIALRWLVIFSVVMWAMLCCIDRFVFKVKQIKCNGKFYGVEVVFVLRYSISLVPTLMVRA